MQRPRGGKQFSPLAKQNEAEFRGLESLNIRLCGYRGIRDLIGCVKDLEFDCKPQREVLNSL